MSNLPVIAIVDIETTGLEPTKNAMLELGILLVNQELEVVGEFTEFIVDYYTVTHLDWLKKMSDEAEADNTKRVLEPWKGARIVYEMHQRSGLDAIIRESYDAGVRQTSHDVECNAIQFLHDHGISPQTRVLEMTGSSILLDRSFIQLQMSTLNESFHYRNTDISSVKTLCKLYRNDLVELRDKSVIPQGLHRALPDCYDSLMELEFYLNELFIKGK